MVFMRIGDEAKCAFPIRPADQGVERQLPLDANPLFSGVASLRHPFGEELDPGLSPRALSFRRWGRHDGSADPANAVVDDSRVRSYLLILSKIESLAHRM